jgi:hypothetical protein
MNSDSSFDRALELNRTCLHCSPARTVIEGRGNFEDLSHLLTAGFSPPPNCRTATSTAAPAYS